MARIAMKVAYDGGAFHGHARQPGVPTVEGEILFALARARAIRDTHSPHLESASRTDRGVSALGNVVAFDTELAPVSTARAFNAKARGVWAWAIAPVAPTFRARRARERRYEYLLPGSHDERRLAEALRTFVGEHDFRNFTRDRERTVLRLDEVGAKRDAEAVVLEFRAMRFAWNLVRRLVAAALRVESGDASIQDLERALQPGSHDDFGLAPPEPLMLVDVRYDIEFQPVRDPATYDRIRRGLVERLREASFLRNLEARFRADDAPAERLI